MSDTDVPRHRPGQPGEGRGGDAGDVGLFGPDSVTWRLHAEPLMGIAGARALLLQALHPVAMTAFDEHGTLRRPCAVVELHHLPTGTVAAAAHGPEGLARKVAEAESVAQEARAADEAYAAGDTEEAFPARPSSLCSWCDFRPACPQGRAAAPQRDPWDAVLPDAG